MKKYISAAAVLGLIVFCGVAAVLQSGEIQETQDDIEAMAQAEVIAEEEVPTSMADWRDNHLKVKGIYVTGPTAGSERMDDIISLVNETELNAVVIDVKDDAGNVTFKMNNENVISMDAGVAYIKDIEKLLAELKKNDIYVIARIPCFKDPILAATHPELALTASDGSPVTDANGNAWVNPTKEEVWDYILSLVDSCCELGFDEIQLDYVRFPIGQNAEEALYGAVSDDDNRQSYITQFLGRVCDEAHKYNVPVAADVFGTIIKSTADAKHVGQDYVTLVSNLDVICPMIYPSHYAAGEFGLDVPDAAPYDTIYAALEGSNEALESLRSGDGASSGNAAGGQGANGAVVRPWLQAFTASWVDGYINYGGPEIRQQIEAVYAAGYEEWILWNSKSDYSMGGLEK
ncbi:putative glycoside hydrolase [Pseudobutyrivibrio xylanivorans]|uniref:Sugar fermentation stimulation protein n=1 Tax=Pseudobutyrivibrio xylanivorans TaxID=185007 RepID=A0A5P6VRG4_PSEXY|nr:putative glycoside hydrolase [Pseudobutyrivibrio xylanivorans]QFJ55207.1 sugar fermentation stimulation protein [Pseudobutyrivibrio xylanivorans]